MNHIYRLVWNNAVRAWQPFPNSPRRRAARIRRAVRPDALAAPCWPWRWRWACPAGAGWQQPSTAVLSASPPTVCDTPAFPLQPHYSTSVNNVTITVLATGSLGVIQSMGGTALTLQGSNATLDNSGKISPARSARTC